MNPVLERYKAPESNVFLMTRFRDAEYHQEISSAIQYAVKAFGLDFVRADDPNWPGPVLWERVQNCLDACHYGIAVFEAIDETGFNPNIAFELGYMRALKRECLLLKEKRLKSLPTDLCGDVYKEFDSMNISYTILSQMTDWLKEIGARKRDHERLVVFVSTGGTCRCAIAKAIVTKLLKGTKDWPRIRVESRAMHGPTLRTATREGISAVKNTLGEDMLSNHRARKVGVGFLFEADLILAMSERVRDDLLNIHLEYQGDARDREVVAEEIHRKTCLVTNFFKSSGDIDDPYGKGLPAYEECVNNLCKIIMPQINCLTGYLLAPNPPMKRTVAFGGRQLSS